MLTYLSLDMPPGRVTYEFDLEKLTAAIREAAAEDFTWQKAANVYYNCKKASKNLVHKVYSKGRTLKERMDMELEVIYDYLKGTGTVFRRGLKFWLCA